MAQQPGSSLAQREPWRSETLYFGHEGDLAGRIVFTTEGYLPGHMFYSVSDQILMISQHFRTHTMTFDRYLLSALALSFRTSQ